MKYLHIFYILLLDMNNVSVYTIFKDSTNWSNTMPVQVLKVKEVAKPLQHRTYRGILENRQNFHYKLLNENYKLYFAYNNGVE